MFSLQIFKSLIRIFFLDFALESFYSNAKSILLSGFEDGEEISWQALYKGMHLRKISEIIDGDIYTNYNCVILNLDNSHVSFTSDYLSYINPRTNTEQKLVYSSKESDFVAISNSKFYL